MKKNASAKGFLGSWHERMAELNRVREWSRVAELSVIRDEQLIQRVICVNYHRNGVGGVPFDVVVFEHRTYQGKTIVLWGIVFEHDYGPTHPDAERRTAVIDPSDYDSHWRGENFDPFLRRIIAIDRKN